MRRMRSLCVELLEERKLLSRAHEVAHVKPAAAMTALVITGTLTVDNNAATETEDDEGDVMTSTPVAGQLGGSARFTESGTRPATNTATTSGPTVCSSVPRADPLWFSSASRIPTQSTISGGA